MATELSHEASPGMSPKVSMQTNNFMSAPACALSSSKSGFACPLARFVPPMVLIILGLAIAAVTLSAQARNTVSDVNDATKPAAVAGLVTQALTASNVLPSKYATPYVPPAKLQLARGTCWDFATIAVVEHMYRQQGIAKGFLKPHEYVRFSEQTYGSLVIKYCAQNPMLCTFPGDGIAFGTTEGGETNVLYTFAVNFSKALLPDAVCPYISISGNHAHDLDCPDLDAALASNPIKATMHTMEPLYDINDIKKKLLASGVSLTIGVSVTGSYSYLRCDDPNGDWALDCVNNSKPCPLDYGQSECHAIERAWYNMNGEVGNRHELQPEAGHAVMVVGYNDNFQTEDGYTGGLIFRNSWKDGVYSWAETEFRSDRYSTRGGHSIAYFMQTISDADEKVLCPNMRYPRNWATSSDLNFDPAHPVYTQQDVNAALYELSPLFLLCSPNNTDTALCTNTSVYVSQGYTPYLDGTYLFTLTQITPVPFDAHKFPVDVKNAKTVHLPARTMEQIAQAFIVMETDTYKQRHNLKDFCDFYLLPYDYLRLAEATFHAVAAAAYTLEFDPQSYAANKAAYPTFNYTYIEKSTYNQTAQPVFVDFYPNTVPGFPTFNDFPQQPDQHSDLLSHRVQLQAAAAHRQMAAQREVVLSAQRAQRMAAVARFDAGQTVKALPRLHVAPRVMKKPKQAPRPRHVPARRP